MFHPRLWLGSGEGRPRPLVEPPVGREAALKGPLPPEQILRTSSEEGPLAGAAYSQAWKGEDGPSWPPPPMAWRRGRGGLPVLTGCRLFPAVWPALVHACTDFLSKPSWWPVPLATVSLGSAQGGGPAGAVPGGLEQRSSPLSCVSTGLCLLSVVYPPPPAAQCPTRPPVSGKGLGTSCRLYLRE